MIILKDKLTIKNHNEYQHFKFEAKTIYRKAKTRHKTNNMVFFKENLLRRLHKRKHFI